MDTKKIKFSIYMITVLISLYAAFQFGKNDIMACMLTAIIILGVGGYFIFVKKKNDTFIRLKDVFACMWTVQYLVLPIGKRPNLSNIEVTVQKLSHAFDINNNMFIKYSGALIIYTGTLILLQVLGKNWKDILAYRVGLYAIVSLIAGQIFQIAFGLDTSFIYYVAIFAYLCEYISKKRFRNKTYFKEFLLFDIALFAVLMLYPYAGLVERLVSLFYLGNIWSRVTVIILICGVICIVEDYEGLQDLSEGKMTEALQTGCALICMAVYIFLGKAWPQFAHILIVYIATPASILLAEYADKRMIPDRMKYLVWIGIMVCLPAAGRTLNENSRFYFVVIALLIVRFILLKITWKNVGRNIILLDFWGIAAAVLLFCSRKEIFDMNVIRTLGFSLIVLAGSCVMWGVLTHSTYVFDKQLREGKYVKYDYEVIPRLQRMGICLVMAITLFRLLF